MDPVRACREARRIAANITKLPTLYAGRKPSQFRCSGHRDLTTSCPRLIQSGSGIGHLRVLFLFQERNDDGDSLLGLFLHDPVAGIVDDRAANVRGGKADFRCEVSAI